MDNKKEFFTKNKIINAWYCFNSPSDKIFRDLGIDEGSIVFLYNDESGKRNITSVNGKNYFYFFIDKENLSKFNEIYNGLMKKYDKTPDKKFQVGEKYIRIHYPVSGYQGKDPIFMELIKSLEENKVRTYEAEISPMKRFCLDYDVKIEDWNKVRKIYIDIETDDSKNDIEIGRDRILSFAAIDGDGKEFYFTNQNERELLLEIKKFIMGYDMMIGWNSSGFDVPYLQKRFYANKIPVDYIYNILHEDMMKRVQYFYSKDPEARQDISSYSLESISNYFLKESKVKHTEKIIELFEKNPGKLKEYNLQDVKLLKKLEDKLGLIELTYQLFQTCQCFAHDWSTVKTIDNFILNDANKHGIHYPTHLIKLGMGGDQKETEYLGAFVLDPEPGYYENVYDLDFASLYPNIIRTFNISPDSVIEPHNAVFDPEAKSIKTPEIKDEDGNKHGGMYYNKETIGIIPNKIAILLEDRKKIKKQMKECEKGSEEYRNLNVKQLVVKELANSIYGVLGNQYFRCFDIRLAESITATGQYFIKWLREYFNSSGRKAIYGDTDSIFVIPKDGENMEEVLKKVNEDISEHAKKEFRVNESYLNLQLDVVFNQFLILSKKKYVGKSGEKMKYVGMECVKRDTIPLAVSLQRELIDRIFKKNKIDTVEKFIEKKKKEVLEKDFDLGDIVIRKKISKDLDTYKGKDSTRTYTAPIHIRIAKDLKKKGKKDGKTVEYSSGSIIQYVITDGKGGKINSAIPSSEFDGQWDREYYWNNIVYPLLERILEVVFKEKDWSEYRIQNKKTRKKKNDSQLELL